MYKNLDPTGEAARAQRLADQYGFPYVNLEHFQIDHQLFRDIPLELMIRYQFLPERRDNGHISVVVGTPWIAASFSTGTPAPTGPMNPGGPSSASISSAWAARKSEPTALRSLISFRW